MVSSDDRTTGLTVSGSYSRPRILIVDDEESVLEIFVDLFSERDYDVSTAGNGEAALAQLETGSFDLLLTDINLPGVDGLEVVARAKKFDPEIVVLVITGFASTSTAIDALRHGAYDYITKPFDLWNVDQVVTRGIQARRLKQENRQLLEYLTSANEELQRHEEILREKVNIATRQMSTLYEVGQQISESLNLNQTMDVIVEKAVSLTGARSGIVLLNQGNSGQLAGIAGMGMDPEFVPTFRIRSDEGLNGRVVRSRTAEIAESLADPSIEPLCRLGANSALAVPLLSKGELIGVIDVMNKDGGPFLPADQNVLTMFASQAAIAIVNAQLYSQAKEIDRMKSEFVAVVSHELRTPLTAMKGSLEILSDREYFTINDKQQKLLGICMASVERLINQINDILDFSKIEGSKLPLNFETVDAAEMVRGVFEHLAPLARKKSIELAFKPTGQLPTFTADGMRIAQVLTNLVGNALKFSPEKTTVEVSVDLDAEEILFTVSDQGPGIANEYLPLLFQKFKQLDSSHTRKVGGTGLGLFISRGIVEGHGGRIYVESGGSLPGSRFCFRLPLDPAVARAA
ncbi:MAG: response regulator [Candidatus Eisenbacteria bacterium]|nr:response regulator [Candidatus Eisenbacteria bacterium]